MTGLADVSFSAVINSIKKVLLDGLPMRLRRSFSLQPPLTQVAIDRNFEKKISELVIGDRLGLHLILDETLFVKHSFNVPKTSGGDVRRLVELEAERVMPITVARLHLAWRRKIGDNPERMLVDVYGVRISMLEQIEDQARKFGIPLRKMSISDRDSSDLVEVHLRSIRSQNLILKFALLMVIATSFFIVRIAPDIYQDRLNAKSDDLDRSISAARRSTSAVTNLQREMRSMQTLAAQIHNQRLRGQITDILVQITQSSPDDVVITELRLDRDRLYLSGIAAQPELWVLEFAKHAAFEDVSLMSVTQASAPQSQRFELRATVRWPEERL